MEKHHDFSPSSMGRIAGCPWSYKLCKGWERPQSSDAEHGTLLHQAMYDDAAFENLTGSDKKTVAELRAEHVEPYKGFECYHEIKLEIWIDNALFNFGTADFVVISPDGKNASLKDWKFGGYEVASAKDNHQLKNYVVGLFQRFPKLERVYAMTVQPVYGTADYDEQHEFTRDDLPELIAELKSIKERALNATEADAVSTPENCRYCNKNACARYLRKMDENFAILGIESAELSGPDHEMTIEFADRLLLAEKDIKKAMESKVAMAKKLIIANGGSTSFAMREGRVTKTTDWKGLCEKHGICDEEIAAFTTEKQGDPFLAPKMRRKQITNAN